MCVSEMETPSLHPYLPVMGDIDTQVCVKIEDDTDHDVQVCVRINKDPCDILAFNEDIIVQANVKAQKHSKKRLASKTDVKNDGKKRRKYSEEDDLEILAYLEMNGGFPIRKGFSIWKKMEEEQIVPGRTWESLRSRCNNILIPTFFQHDELPDLEPDPDDEKLPKQIRYLKTALPIPKDLGISEEDKLHPLCTMQKHLAETGDKALVTFVQNEGRLYETKNENKSGYLDVIPIPRQKKKKKTKEEGNLRGKPKIPRREYTAEEDEILVKYVQDHGIYAARKGRHAWELMEKLNVLPNRTWGSMKQRCLRTLFPKMSERDFYKPTNDTESPVWKEFKLNRMVPVYTIEEDNEIVRYIADHEYYNDVNTLKLWKKLARRGTIGKRGFKSLSDRFRRIIRYKIRMGCYDLTYEERCQFPKPD